MSEPGDPQSADDVACEKPVKIEPSSSDREDTEATKLSDSWLQYKWGHYIVN